MPAAFLIAILCLAPFRAPHARRAPPVVLKVSANNQQQRLAQKAAAKKAAAAQAQAEAEAAARARKDAQASAHDSILEMLNDGKRDREALRHLQRAGDEGLLPIDSLYREVATVFSERKRHRAVLAVASLCKIYPSAEPLWAGAAYCFVRSAAAVEEWPAVLAWWEDIHRYKPDDVKARECDDVALIAMLETQRYAQLRSWMATWLDSPQSSLAVDDRASAIITHCAAASAVHPVKLEAAQLSVEALQLTFGLGFPDANLLLATLRTCAAAEAWGMAADLLASVDATEAGDMPEVHRLAARVSAGVGDARKAVLSLRKLRKIGEKLALSALTFEAIILEATKASRWADVRWMLAAAIREGLELSPAAVEIGLAAHGQHAGKRRFSPRRRALVAPLTRLRQAEVPSWTALPDSTVVDRALWARLQSLPPPPELVLPRGPGMLSSIEATLPASVLEDARRAHDLLTMFEQAGYETSVEVLAHIFYRLLPLKYCSHTLERLRQKLKIYRPQNLDQARFESMVLPRYVCEDGSDAMLQLFLEHLERLGKWRTVLEMVEQCASADNSLVASAATYELALRELCEPAAWVRHSEEVVANTSLTDESVVKLLAACTNSNISWTDFVAMHPPRDLLYPNYSLRVATLMMDMTVMVFERATSLATRGKQCSSLEELAERQAKRLNTVAPDEVPPPCRALIVARCTAAADALDAVDLLPRYLSTLKATAELPDKKVVAKVISAVASLGGGGITSDAPSVALNAFELLPVETLTPQACYAALIAAGAGRTEWHPPLSKDAERAVQRLLRRMEGCSSFAWLSPYIRIDADDLVFETLSGKSLAGLARAAVTLVRGNDPTPKAMQAKKCRLDFLSRATRDELLVGLIALSHQPCGAPAVAVGALLSDLLEARASGTSSDQHDLSSYCGEVAQEGMRIDVARASRLAVVASLSVPPEQGFLGRLQGDIRSNGLVKGWAFVLMPDNLLGELGRDTFTLATEVWKARVPGSEEHCLDWGVDDAASEGRSLRQDLHPVLFTWLTYKATTQPTMHAGPHLGHCPVQLGFSLFEGMRIASRWGYSAAHATFTDTELVAEPSAITASVMKLCLTLWTLADRYTKDVKRGHKEQGAGFGSSAAVPTGHVVRFTSGRGGKARRAAKRTKEVKGKHSKLAVSINPAEDLSRFLDGPLGDVLRLLDLQGGVRGPEHLQMIFVICKAIDRIIFQTLGQKGSQKLMEASGMVGSNIKFSKSALGRAMGSLGASNAAGTPADLREKLDPFEQRTATALAIIITLIIGRKEH